LAKAKPASVEMKTTARADATETNTEFHTARGRLMSDSKTRLRFSKRCDPGINEGTGFCEMSGAVEDASRNV
jgi:hypothetical protein